jgi:hypothetical protein
VLDPATGRVRADLGGWRQVYGPDATLAYVVNAGHPTFFGRFDPARTAVRILGTTDEEFGHCDAAAGAVVCHLTDGPVAISASRSGDAPLLACRHEVCRHLIGRLAPAAGTGQCLATIVG